MFKIVKIVLVASLLILPFVLAKAAPPTNAVKFVILNPDDSAVGAPVTVTVEAQKNNNQVDTSYQNDVTLIAGGSATGGGLVDIVNGVGSLQINDLVAETVTLSLSDTKGTGLTITSTQNVVFASAEAASWRQQSFWFKDDDGAESPATGFGTANTGVNSNITDIKYGIGFRIRFQIRVAQNAGTIIPRLEFKEGGNCATGSWTPITAGSSIFRLNPSVYFADGASTTQQLGGGSNFVQGYIWDSSNPGNSQILLKNEFTEYEWNLGITPEIQKSTDYVFRVSNNATALNVYNQCPTARSEEIIKGSVSPTTVVFSGTAFPGSSVSIVNKDANFESTVSQDAKVKNDGAFETRFVGILQSAQSFGLMVKDKNGNITQSKFFNVDTVSNSLTQKDIFVPPTVDLERSSVTRGEVAIVEGYAAPKSNVTLEINGRIKKEALAGEDGFYRAELPTGELEFGTVKIRARQENKGLKKESDFSPLRTFVVSKLVSPKTDLSGDGIVNIRDWSIFLSNWGSKDQARKKLIDVNEDGEIDISDFSIFIKSVRK